MLANLTLGAIGAAAFVAIVNRDKGLLAHLSACCEALPDGSRALASAMGWASRDDLRGIVAPMLSSSVPFHRSIALAACAMQRVDPGAALLQALSTESPAIRTCALRTAAALGNASYLGPCLVALATSDDDVRFEAARAALLLGDRGDSLRLLRDTALVANARQIESIYLVLGASTPSQAANLLKTMSADAASPRALITAAGVAGDPALVDWLIERMATPEFARCAGQSVSLITGCDLVKENLETRAPRKSEDDDEGRETSIAEDPDAGLPWPDSAGVARWWLSNRPGLVAGRRHLVGELATDAQCVRVLRRGTQRQRAIAAERLCLLHPGTPLFNVAAPAWRQQRLLDAMSR